eukprot:52544_1
MASLLLFVLSILICDYCAGYILINNSLNYGNGSTPIETGHTDTLQSLFVLIDEPLNYKDGKLRCLQIKSTLATITSPHENEQAKLLCSTSSIYNYKYNKYGCLIGLNDIKTQNQFVWMDGSTSSYRDHSIYGTTDIDADCIRISNYGWHYTSCADKLPILCNNRSIIHSYTSTRYMTTEKEQELSPSVSGIENVSEQKLTLTELFIYTLGFGITTMMCWICLWGGFLSQYEFRKLKSEGLECNAVIYKKYTTITKHKESRPMGNESVHYTTINYHFKIKFVIIEHNNTSDTSGAVSCFLLCNTEMDVDSDRYKRYNLYDIICLKYLNGKNARDIQRLTFESDLKDKSGADETGICVILWVCGCCCYGIPCIIGTFVFGSGNGGIWYGIFMTLCTLINGFIYFVFLKLIIWLKHCCCYKNSKLIITEITKDEYNSFHNRNRVQINNYQIEGNEIELAMGGKQMETTILITDK